MSKTRFQLALESRVKEAVENRSISIANGDVTDYAHYREQVGYIRGLQDALKIGEEIESESN